jgi:predicted Zn finger-like uncharacterized protein
MSLATRCPACGTGFRVGAGQLKAQHGKVRCGRCGAVFNAFDSLSTLPDTPDARTEPAAAPAPAPSPPVPGPHLRDAGAGAAPGAEAAGAERTMAEAPGAAARREEPAAAALPPARRRDSRAWAPGSAVLLLLLAAQLAYLLRTEIAGALPQARPWLEQACAQVGCTVPFARRIEHWSIESSDLQSEPAEPQRMTLMALLRNRAAFSQEFPALELTLNDVHDRPLARRVLTPPEYLPPGVDAGAGLAANAEVVVRLAMDTGGLDAAGYRLFLFYP